MSGLVAFSYDQMQTAIHETHRSGMTPALQKKKVRALVKDARELWLLAVNINVENWML